nr:YfhO family protein [uncultured Anaerobutyricum sp.]
MSIKGKNGTSKREVFSRELIVAFYGVFLIMTMLCHKFEEVSIVHILTRMTQIVYVSGIFFAVGYYIQVQSEKGEDFRGNMLRNAAYSLGLYGALGVLYEVVIEHIDLFNAIRHFITFIKIFKISTVFLSVSILFLLSAYLWDLMKEWLERPVIILLICAVAFLFVFLPKGIIGYGLIGTLVGGDNTSAVAIAPQLFVFFWGVFCARDRQNTFLVKKNLIIAAISFVLAGIFAVLHIKAACFVFLGMFAAFIAVNVCVPFLGIYKAAEEAVVQTGVTVWKKITTPASKDGVENGHSILRYFIGYTLLFLVMIVLIFLPYKLQGKTLIWEADGLGQYVPKVYRFIQYIPEILKDIFSGNFDFRQYDFTTGLGATVAISYDPIYWLYLLFSADHIEKVYSILIIMRYFLAGLSMSCLVLYFKKSHFAAYTASIVYAFSGYAIYAGTKHGQFLTPMILLPVLVVAMERLVRSRKWYMLTVLVAVSLLCSYYFLYMNTIALGSYFILRIVCTKEYRSWKIFFERGFIIVGSYILGASIGIISLFTSFGSYMGSSRSGGAKLSSFLSTTPLFYRTEWLVDFFTSYISDAFTPGLWLKLGFAPIAMFAIVVLFTRKNRKELRWLFVIFTACCFFPICGYIFSGFSNVNNRWCYIYAAVVAFILAESLDKMHDLTGKELGIMTAITGMYGLITVFSDKLYVASIYGAFSLLAMTLVVVFLMNSDRIAISKRQFRAAILGITVLTIFLNARWFITSGSGDNTHLNTYVSVGDSKKEISDTALKNLDKVPGIENEDFYRSTNLVTTGDLRSSSMLYGYNDVSIFSSTLNGGVVNYNNAMGNCRWNIVSIYDYNFRTYLNTLASVKYLGVKKDNKATIPYGYTKVQETKNKKYSIYENKYALPLGYTYDKIVSVDTVDKYSAAEKQDISMLAAIVEDKDMKKNSNITVADKLPATAKKIKIKKMKLDGVSIDGDTIKIEKPGATMKFAFEAPANAETYLSLRGDIYSEKDAKEHFLMAKVQAKGVKYDYKFRIDAYRTGQEEYLFNLGYRQGNLTKCTLKFKDVGTLKYKDIAIYSQTMDNYAEKVNALKENSLQNAKADKNTVTGNITVDKDKMLVITLPYQKGWTAYVDGKKTDIQRVNYQYIGINLKKGTHDIKLHYQLPGIKLAFMITGCGVVVFAAIIIFNIVRKRRRN